MLVKKLRINWSATFTKIRREGTMFYLVADLTRSGQDLVCLPDG